MLLVKTGHDPSVALTRRRPRIRVRHTPSYLRKVSNTADGADVAARADRGFSQSGCDYQSNHKQIPPGFTGTVRFESPIDTGATRALAYLLFFCGRRPPGDSVSVSRRRVWSSRASRGVLRCRLAAAYSRRRRRRRVACSRRLPRRRQAAGSVSSSPASLPPSVSTSRVLASLLIGRFLRSLPLPPGGLFIRYAFSRVLGG